MIGSELIGKYVIARTNSRDIFAGILKERDGQQVTMTDARRIWYWDGAASVSQLAVDGTSKPGNCKFPAEVPTVILTEVIEIIETTEKAEKSIKSVIEWKQ